MALSRHDGINWAAYAEVKKYDAEVVRELTNILGYEPKAADFERFEAEPNGYAHAAGNLLTNAGLQRITNLIIGTGDDAFTDVQSVVGVGDSAASASTSDTALGADGVNAWYNTTDGYPDATDGVITAISTYGSTRANFDWNEWCWVIAAGSITPGATLSGIGTSRQILNHKVSTLGTKASGASWVFTTTITLS